MEKVTKRAYIAAGVLLLGGAFIFAAPSLSYGAKTEKWLEDNSPKAVGDWQMARTDPNNPAISYRMDERTYRMLEPFGIVAREYAKDRKAFDVVVIASNQRKSFHDPRLCFTAQGWSLRDDKADTVETKNHGKIPVSVVRVTGNNQPEKVAIFFYRGPSGFFSTTANLKWNMFWERFKGSPKADGIFYRFIPVSPNTSLEDLKAFVGEYLEASEKASNGYL